MELNHKSWIFFFTIALFRITRAASYTELPGSCGSSDRTDSSERTESSRSGFVSTRAVNPLPRNGFNSSQTGVTLTPMGYTSSSSSLGGPDHPLSTTLSTDEVKHTISSCKPHTSFDSNLPQITLALAPFETNLLLPQIVQIPQIQDNFKPLHFPRCPWWRPPSPPSARWARSPQAWSTSTKLRC